MAGRAVRVEWLAVPSGTWLQRKVALAVSPCHGRDLAARMTALAVFPRCLRVREDLAVVFLKFPMQSVRDL